MVQNTGEKRIPVAQDAKDNIRANMRTKMKIVEISNKYIVCEECNFEESYRLPNQPYGEFFEWKCLNCGQFWQASIDKESGEITASKGEAADKNEFISIILNPELHPTVLMTIDKDKRKQRAFRFIKEETSKTSNLHNMRLYRVLEM